MKEVTVPDLLSLPLISRIRRNHALEHATIHVLSRKVQNLRLMGRSTFHGFVLYGNIPSEAVREAAEEALRRLQAGEKGLAVHPTCGTNFVAGGMLAGLGVFAVLTPRRRSFAEWIGRLPMALMIATVGMIMGQRAGPVLQARLTTDPHVEGMRIRSVTREERGSLVIHYVQTEG